MKQIKFIYKPAGNCPVQSEGFFLDYYFYFRSRGERTTIEFSKTRVCDDKFKYNPEKSFCLWKTEPYSAGWISKEFSLILIYLGCIKFYIYKKLYAYKL